MSDSATYTIKLEHFEGPFDLLLFFIERDELDIYDIPIAKITNDFLAYIKQMERMNIDLASEFIVVAATLCRIKAKLLLPRKAVDEEGNEIDPREELVERLLEYKRYKSILEDMRQLEKRRSHQETRGYSSKELQKIANKALVDVELESLTLFRLLKAFERVMDRFDAKNPQQIHEVVQFSYTIDAEQDLLSRVVSGGRRAEFMDVFGHCKNRIHAITTFLALLELINQQLIRVISSELTNFFYLEEGNGPDKSEEE
ncbi:MAG TPA: segregation/condensation protein A [Saprospiraceae bacterium]|nr:segregation/condensation protein A [Saprospiraceae bacterium]